MNYIMYIFIYVIFAHQNHKQVPYKVIANELNTANSEFAKPKKLKL